MKQQTQRLDIPPPDIGAPLPTVFSAKDRLLLGYYLPLDDPGWDGTYTNVMVPDKKSDVVIVQFEGPVAVKHCTFPDEETCCGGTYGTLDIEPYIFYEIENSAWIRELEKIRMVNDRHWKGLLDDKKHFLCVFHDSSFECIAKTYSWKILNGKSIKDAVIEAAG